MKRKDAEVSKGSYEKRAERLKRDAVDAINSGNIELAIRNLMDAYQLQAVASEYDFICDSWEED